MTLPAIPVPKPLPPAQIDRIAESIIAWARQATDLGEIQEARAQAAALEVYLERRDPEHAQAMRWANRQIEKRLGQLLPGPGRPPENPTRLSELERISEHDHTRCRRMARYGRVWDPRPLEARSWPLEPRPCSQNAVLNVIDEHRAEAGQRARILDADERQIDVPDEVEPIEGDGWTVIPGDFRDVIPKLPEASVDLIVTDPPYSEDALEIWADLSRLAAHLLVPQGILVALTGTIMLPAVLERISSSLQYGWLYAQPLPGTHSRILARHITQAWKPWLAFSKGPWPSGRVDWHDDILPASGRNKTGSAWQQQLRPAQYLIERLCPQNGLVCDPMLGTGTYAHASRRAGRRVIGIEADRDRLKTALERLQSPEKDRGPGHGDPGREERGTKPTDLRRA